MLCIGKVPPRVGSELRLRYSNIAFIGKQGTSSCSKMNVESGQSRQPAEGRTRGSLDVNKLLVKAGNIVCTGQRRRSLLFRSIIYSNSGKRETDVYSQYANTN